MRLILLFAVFVVVGLSFESAGARIVTFRALILCSDTLVIFLITRRWETTGILVIMTNLASTTLYFIHERAWSRIAWGRVA